MHNEMQGSHSGRSGHWDIKRLFGLTGKNVAITGSDSGMSRAATEMFIALGANVYAVDIADIDLPVTAAFKADLSDRAQVDAWLGSLLETVDAVFMCHGIPGRPGIWCKMMQINFFSQKYAMERLLPRMSDSASVTFISSMGGLGWQRTHKEYLPLVEAEGWDAMEEWYDANAEMVESDQNPYAISKRLICSYVARMCMAPEFVAKHIRVNSICPGMTNTGLTDQFAQSAGEGDVAEGNRRLASTFIDVWGGQNASSEEMGQPLVVLGSAICSYVSGVNLLIDHGVSAFWESNSLLGEGTTGVF